MPWQAQGRRDDKKRKIEKYTRFIKEVERKANTEIKPVEVNVIIVKIPQPRKKQEEEEKEQETKEKTPPPPIEDLPVPGGDHGGQEQEEQQGQGNGSGGREGGAHQEQEQEKQQEQQPTEEPIEEPAREREEEQEQPTEPTPHPPEPQPPTLSPQPPVAGSGGGTSPSDVEGSKTTDVSNTQQRPEQAPEQAREQFEEPPQQQGRGEELGRGAEDQEGGQEEREEGREQETGADEPRASGSLEAGEEKAEKPRLDVDVQQFVEQVMKWASTVSSSYGRAGEAFDVEKIGSTGVARKIVQFMNNLIDMIAEDRVKREGFQGDMKYMVKRMIKRSIRRLPPSYAKVPFEHENLIMVFDTSPSMSNWADVLAEVYRGLSNRKDLALIRAPNMIEIADAKGNIDHCIKKLMSDKTPDWSRLHGYTIIVFTDSDGSHAINELKKNNNVITIFPPNYNITPKDIESLEGTITIIPQTAKDIERGLWTILKNPYRTNYVLPYAFGITTPTSYSALKNMINKKD